MRLSSFCFGLGVGAVLGVLFAPRSGEETREEIAGAIRANMDEAGQKGRTLVRRAQRRADQVLNDVREHVKDAAEAVEHRLT